MGYANDYTGTINTREWGIGPQNWPNPKTVAPGAWPGTSRTTAGVTEAPVEESFEAAPLEAEVVVSPVAGDTAAPVVKEEAAQDDTESGEGNDTEGSDVEVG